MRSHRILRHLLLATAVFVALGLAFGYGVVVGRFRAPPFFFLKKAQDTLVDRWRERGLESEEILLRAAFTDPMIKGEQILQPIASLDGIRHANASMALLVDTFFEAYDRLHIVDASRLTLDGGATHVLKVTYELAANEYSAYAYDVDPAQSHRAAALVIPGTGLNQSSAIYSGDHSNYQYGILNALKPRIDRFIFIKPNEDCIAFHNGSAKLNQGFYINWLLNRGGSYSAYYIANSLALTRYLQTQYDAVAVVGLSQGGHAALLNALQSEPSAAVIASGFSILDARDMAARHDQIVIPGLLERLGVDDIRVRMESLTTHFLFSYGKAEGGAYGIEASEGRTCEFLSSLANVECQVHDGGHRFPVEIIRDFFGNG